MPNTKIDAITGKNPWNSNLFTSPEKYKCCDNDRKYILYKNKKRICLLIIPYER